MKTLFLVRHGKSSWHYPELDDRERPLKNRGENDALLMGGLLYKQEIKPDSIVSSPAKRAVDTAKIFAKELHYKDEIAIDDRLYMDGLGIMKTVISTPDEVENLFIFSHNPAVLDLANSIKGADYENVPTCGVVCIDFDVRSWKEAAIHNASIRFFDYPSKHK